MITMKAPPGVTSYSHGGETFAVANGRVEVSPELAEELRAHGFAAKQAPLDLDSRSALLRRFSDDARAFAETLNDDELRGLTTLAADKRDRVFNAVRALAQDAATAKAKE